MQALARKMRRFVLGTLQHIHLIPSDIEYRVGRVLTNQPYKFTSVAKHSKAKNNKSAI